MKQSLVSNVVDGEKGSRVGEERIFLINRFKIGRDQPGLPFMVMDNLRANPMC